MQESLTAAGLANLKGGRLEGFHDARSKAMELFNLKADPKGLVNVVEKHRDQATILLSTLAAYDLGDAEGQFVKPEATTMTKEMKDRLKALGYLEDEEEEDD